MINLFVLPIALAGVLRGAGDGDLFVLLLPMASGHEWLALVAYLGGLSAASAMIIVATVALSTMISNDLVMPVLLRLRAAGPAASARDLPRLILTIRRACHPAPPAAGLRLLPAGRRAITAWSASA